MVAKARTTSQLLSIQSHPVAVVTYGREVLVTNPKNRYENQKFRLELTDVRWEGETYEQVRNRLKAEVNRMLLNDIDEYVNGVAAREKANKQEVLARQYNLL